MAQLYGPFNAGTGASFDETDWREAFGNLISSGVIKGGKVNGTTGGDLAGSIPGTGLTVNIATGLAIAYGFAYENTASLALTLANRDTTLDRIDRIVIRMNFTGQIVDAQILQGTPASSPTPPALTQYPSATTWEIPICQVRVNHNADPDANLASGDLTDERAYAGGLPPMSQGSGSLLDADKLDGYHATNSSGGIPLNNSTLNNNLNADQLDGYHAGNSSGQVPVSNGTLSSNLNADQLDSNHASVFVIGAAASQHILVLNRQPVDGDGVNGDLIFWW